MSRSLRGSGFEESEHAHVASTTGSPCMGGKGRGKGGRREGVGKGEGEGKTEGGRRHNVAYPRRPSVGFNSIQFRSPQYNSIRLSYARPRSLSANKLIITGQTHTKFKLHSALSPRASPNGRGTEAIDGETRVVNAAASYAIQFCLSVYSTLMLSDTPQGR